MLERISPASRSPRRMIVPGAGGAPVKATGSSRLRTSPRYFMRAVSSWPTKQPLAKSTPFSSSKPLSSRVERSTTRSRLPSGTPSVSRAVLVGGGARAPRTPGLERAAAISVGQQQPAHAELHEPRIDQHEALAEHRAGARASRQVELRGAPRRRARLRQRSARSTSSSSTLERRRYIISRRSSSSRRARSVSSSSCVARCADQEVEQELALRREQGAVTRLSARDSVRFVADQTLEERSVASAPRTASTPRSASRTYPALASSRSGFGTAFRRVR